MLIECLTRRDGPTSIRYGDFELKFEKNAKGHSVCDVHSEGAVDFLLRSDSFRPYQPQERREPKADPTRDEQIMALRAQGKSLAQIGKEIGVSKATVSLRLRALKGG